MRVTGYGYFCISKKDMVADRCWINFYKDVGGSYSSLSWSTKKGFLKFIKRR